ncbi:MAG: ATP-binding protein [Methanomassiliicoccus sp.]|nr:ATP-binding protein [Methanomassiliicoccus sp.]
MKNFRSFKDEQRLSMLASSDDSLPGNVSDSSNKKGERLVNSAAIYGANASGKSNLVIALSLLKNLVGLSHQHQKGVWLNFQPFKFDPRCAERPTTFDIEFIKAGIRYSYHLAFTSKEITEESLHYYPNNRRAMVFTRHKQNFDFNMDKKEQEVISRRTLENTLYLSTSVQFNYEGTMKAFEWFQNDLIVLDTTAADQLMDRVIDRMNRNKRFKDNILKALRIADLGIVGVKGRVRTIPLSEMEGKMPPQIIGAMTMLGAPVVMRDLSFTHSVRLKNGSDEHFDLDHMHESEGTRRLFSIIGPIIDSLSEGKAIVIDEMDTKLHHDLSEWIVGLFHDPEQNSKGAQLIFNTHDGQLLDLSLFRRDQIWFVEKDAECGSTSLYSLAEFGERKDRDVLKAYRLGRYGAVPFISDEKVL